MDEEFGNLILTCNEYNCLVILKELMLKKILFKKGPSARGLQVLPSGIREEWGFDICSLTPGSQEAVYNMGTHGINCTSFLIQEYFPVSGYASRITFTNTKETMNHKLSISHLHCFVHNSSFYNFSYISYTKDKYSHPKTSK